MFQTNDEVKQNRNWDCSLPCPDAGYKYHRPGATKAVDAKAGFSCGFQWSGGVGVRSIFGFGYDREASGFVGCVGFFFGCAESLLLHVASGCRARARGCVGLSSCSSRVLEQRLSSCAAWA